MVRRQVCLIYLIDFGTPLSGRWLILTTWLTLRSKLFIRFSNFLDVGDSEPNELRVWLLVNEWPIFVMIQSRLIKAAECRVPIGLQSICLVIKKQGHQFKSTLHSHVVTVIVCYRNCSDIVLTCSCCIETTKIYDLTLSVLHNMLTFQLDIYCINLYY